MAVLSKGSLFDPVLVEDLFNKVKGHSSLAKLSGMTPISFNGNKEFTFSMDKEVDIVAENGTKSEGGVTIAPLTIVPIKMEYGARVSDEFMYAEEETQLNILQAFNDGFSVKVARGLDLAAIHGVNPRTGTASAVVGTNNFDTAITQTVEYTEADPDTNVEAAVALVQGSDGDISGIAMSSIFSGALAKLKVNGVKQFPELAWGANPTSVNGLPSDVNSTISGASSEDRAIVGDYAGMFKWGYAKQIPVEMIPYGDPDNSGVDLKSKNQVYIRAEVYLGWGIMDPASFCRIATA